MWSYIAAVLGGMILGYFVRMVQQAYYFAHHGNYAGTLSIVEFNNTQDMLLELNEPPDNLKNGSLVVMEVRRTRR